MNVVIRVRLIIKFATGTILNSGKINMSECLGCLDCQVIYNDYSKCPPLVVLNRNS